LKYDLGDVVWMAHTDVSHFKAHNSRSKEPDVAEAVKQFFELIDTNGGPFHFNLTAV
jgi:hypothetical protein